MLTRPANLDFEQAAVVPVSGLTALQAVRDTGCVEAGQQVLAIGASGGVGAPLLSLFVRQRLAMLTNKEHHSYLEALRPLIEAGQVTPAVDKIYPLADAPAAMRRLEGGQARGKIAITI